MSDRDRRYSKRELLGNLHVDYVKVRNDLLNIGVLRFVAQMWTRCATIKWRFFR